MRLEMDIAANFSSPLRGEVGAQAPGGGDGVIISNTPTLILPPLGEGNTRVSSLGVGKKPFSKNTQKNAKRLRNRLTEAEKKLWYFLRNKQMGVKFRRQQPMGAYIVDFISFDANLIIELDGGPHGSRQAHDATRDAYLRKEGFEVLRFWNNEVLENIDGVLQSIIRSHPLLTSPLQGEERHRQPEHST